MTAQDKVSKDNVSEIETKTSQIEAKDAPVPDFKQQMLSAMSPEVASLIQNRGIKDETVERKTTLSKEDT